MESETKMIDRNTAQFEKKGENAWLMDDFWKLCQLKNGLIIEIFNGNDCAITHQGTIYQSRKHRF